MIATQRSQFIRRAGRVSILALVITAVAFSFAFYDLTHSNKPHELRFETLVYSMLGIVLLLGGWTAAALFASHKASRDLVLTGTDLCWLVLAYLFVGALLFALLGALWITVRSWS